MSKESFLPVWRYQRGILILRYVTSVFAILVMTSVASAQGMTAQEKYDALIERGIFAGINGAVALDQPMTRLEFAKVVGLLGFEGLPGNQPANTFPGVDPFAIMAIKDQSQFEEYAAFVAKFNGLNQGSDPGELQAWLEQVHAGLIAHGIQLQLPGYTPPTPMEFVAFNQAVNDTVQNATNAAEAARREAEQRKQELLRLVQERQNQASAGAPPTPPTQQISAAQNARLAALEAALRKAQEQLEAKREEAERRAKQLALLRAQQAAALLAQQNANRWPAWMTADSRYADLRADRTTPELITFSTMYSGEARATDGQGNDIVGSFAAYFHSGPDAIATEGVIFGLEFEGDVYRGQNNFSATIFSGTTDLGSGAEEFYTGGRLDGHFYGTSGQALGGTVNLVGDGSPDMSGHFVGLAP
jgi:hypothetical protein